MYSVVLATMLTAGSATPAWHHCHSCYSSSCYCSSCYSGYAGYAGYGCCSYSCHTSHHVFPIFHRHCYSSCSCSCGVVYYSGCSCYSPCSCTTYYYSPCCGGVVAPQVVPVPPAKGGEKVPGPKEKKPGEEQSARVTVNLPSDARLWVDAVECPLTSSVRSFNTPALNPGQRYAYNLKAEIVRDGRTITETQRVVLTPGEESRVDFSSNGGAIATASR